MIARIHGCIAHHRCGVPKAIVDVRHGNIDDEIHKPTLHKIF